MKKAGFVILVAVLLAGGFALGSSWFSGDTGWFPGLFGPSLGRPSGVEDIVRKDPPNADEPEIRIVEQKVHLASHSPVKTDSSGPPPSVEDAAAITAPPGSVEGDLVYAVQVGAFRNPDDARDLTKRLTNRGYTAYIVIAEVPALGMLHKVRVGRYESRPAADRMAKKMLQKEGLQSFVTYR